MAQRAKVVVVLKEGVDFTKWQRSLEEMLAGAHLEDPDMEIETRSYVIDNVVEATVKPI